MDSVGQSCIHVSRRLCQVVRSNNILTRLKTPAHTRKPWTPVCSLSTSQVQNLKDIQVKTEGKLTEIKGVYIEDKEQARYVNFDAPHKKICPLCPHKLKTEVKYTDVLVLSQFLRPDGCLLPRYVTGNCTKAQHRLEILVNRAQRAGLLPEFRPDLLNGKERTSLKSASRWKRFNIFYTD